MSDIGLRAVARLPASTLRHVEIESIERLARNSLMFVRNSLAHCQRLGMDAETCAELVEDINATFARIHALERSNG